MIAILVMPAKLVTLSLLKIEDNFTDKILSRNTNYIVDAVI